jgi:hypothetical protein
LISLSGTSQVTPNFWADPKTGINYPVAIQTPQHLVDSVDALTSTSLAGRDPAHPQLLSNIVSLDRAETPAVESHSNVQPVFDVYANVQGADLGRVSDKVTKVVNELRPKLAPGNTIAVRGQVESMNTAFSKLGLGLILRPCSSIFDGREFPIVDRSIHHHHRASGAFAGICGCSSSRTRRSTSSRDGRDPEHQHRAAKAF